MRYVHWMTCLVVLGLVLTAGCGGKEPIIETAAADMNLTAEEMGAGWTLMAEQGLEEMPTIREFPNVQDANSRMFGNEESAGMLISMVLTTGSVASARQEMQGKSFQDMMGGMEEDLGIAMADLTPPDVGDEALLMGGTEEELSLNVYVCAFRKANVIAVFALIGPTDAVDEGTVAQYAQALEAKMH
ncbi:MAG TPA: hypothetical protein EYH27_02500 [Anaerolineales bacterium]|nr:hypothetical protein [Anaerolineae bacterium]HIP87293.1 hypothetical protein [Anaerolineales bacterium]